ncbi:serine hydrolase domain-containing protein [Hyalangium rubrum]|uniref:Serine hydrolase domain-containing protein n=1 Tax=Hyalangium rubrum TaxID=3103134 RepID=A0ABU5H3M5_9BACT|nr:serine hydrolase domain-containing protein [Hyalangium sp. s54d21]MDY7228081.1 serine hydrolase domain-containing protein [Hyalangium sp. s54d21]
MSVNETHTANLARYPHLQALLDRVVRDGEQAGITAAVKIPNAAPSWLAAGKIALDTELPFGPETICRIASMTKPVTGLAALQLIEKGALGLDQPIAELLPDFKHMRVATGNGSETRPASRPITVRHLLTLTAGIPHVWQEGPAAELYRRNGLDCLGNFRLTPPHEGELPPPRTLEEFGTRIASLPLAADPGTQWDYGLALDVLGLVIQRASGQRFEDFLRTHLFEPLGMVDTAFYVPAEKLPRLATNYVRKNGALAVQDDRKASLFTTPPGVPSGGGGLVSTARDFARFCQMLLNEGELDGVRIAQPETLRLQRTNLIPDGIEHPEFVLDRADWGGGICIETPQSVRPGGLNVGAYGWTGGVGGTTFWVDPKARTWVVVMVQRQITGPEDTLIDEVRAAARKDLEP